MEDPSLVRGQHAGPSGMYDGRSTIPSRQQGPGGQTPLPQFGHDSRSRDSSASSLPAAGGARAALQRVRSGFALAAGRGDASTDEQRRLLEDLHYKTGPQHAMHQRERHLKSMGFLIQVPWATFVVVILLTSLVPWRMLAWFLTSLLFTAFLVLIQVFRQSKSVFYLQLSAFGMLAVTMGGFCGSVIYDANAVNYWMARDRHSYNNVGPSALALSYIDANAVSFTKGTRVDVRRSFGLQSPGIDGSILCVAPVMSRATASSREVHFWAVGMDCCEPLSGFRCGQSLRAGVRAGAVESPGGGVGSSYATHKYQLYNRAAQQAAAIYQLTTESRPVFVRWMEDPESSIMRSLDSALDWAALLSVFYGLLSLLLAGGVFWHAVHGVQVQAKPQPV